MRLSGDDLGGELRSSIDGLVGELYSRIDDLGGEQRSIIDDLGVNNSGASTALVLMTLVVKHFVNPYPAV